MVGGHGQTFFQQEILLLLSIVPIAILLLAIVASLRVRH